MTRYLTPAKIALLVVVLLYAEDLVPTSNIPDVLAFLLRHTTRTNRPASGLAAKDTELDQSLPVSVFQSALSHQPSTRPGRSLYDFLLRRLWSIDSFHALGSFMANLPCLLTKPREQIIRERETGEESEDTYGSILRTSPLGAFVRRCHLEYLRLQFQESVSLWQDFLAYRLPTYHDFEKKRPHSETPSNLLDINLTDLHTDLSHPLTQIMYGRLADDEQEHRGVFSTYDIERLMEFQLNELQRAGGRLSDSMRMEFNRMARAGAEIPARGHYLNFLDAWRAGDYASASDNLHRLSDYAMQTGEQVSYQYALLNLAVLQADFGAYAEALPAIQEAIAVARENKDTECLNCCMGWIYHFVRAFPSQKKALGNCGILGDEVEGLTFLKSRAKDAEMWALLAGTLINEANLCLQRGDSLAGVFENIAKASHLNINKCSQLMAGQVLLMKGATYSRIGLTRLAWTCAQTFLHCHTAGGASMEELLKSHCRTAGLLVQRGRYAEADAILGRVPAEALRVVKIQTYWDFYARLLKVRRMLHRDDLDGAEYLVDRLRGQGLADVEMAVSLTLLDADLSMRRGDFGQALKLVEALARRRDQDESHDIIVQTRLLNLKARILVESGHPLKGFSIVMRAAQTAYRARLLPSLWESIGLLASILIHLGEYFAAMDLLQSIMPQVLELQDCHFAGRSYATLADAFMGLASLEQGNPTKQKEYISKAMENIDQASQQFRFVEDLRDQRGMLKKKATILHWRGDLMLANDTATQYLELRTQYESQRV